MRLKRLTEKLGGGRPRLQEKIVREKMWKKSK